MHRTLAFRWPSVRALAALKRDGLIDRIGLCNVTVGQIDEARQIAEIDSVQVEVSLWHERHFLSGVVQYCCPAQGSRRSRASSPPGATSD